MEDAPYANAAPAANRVLRLNIMVLVLMVEWKRAIIFPLRRGKIMKDGVMENENGEVV